MWLPILITVLVSYLLGNLNGAFNVSLLIADQDVRKKGSGNAGLTNFIRNFGLGSAALVALVDVIKAVLSCLLGMLLLKPYGYALEGMMLGALAVSLGHDFPALLGFRGGKGILSGFAIAIVIDYRCALIIAAVFAVTVAVSKYVSLGSILAAAAFCVSFIVFHHNAPFVMFGGVFLGLLAIYMHRTNIKRLLKGTENKIGAGKKH